MNTLPARLALAMLLVALLALAAFGGSLFVAFDRAGRNVPQVARAVPGQAGPGQPGAPRPPWATPTGPPTPAASRATPNTAGPLTGTPDEVGRFRERVGRGVFEDVLGRVRQGALAGVLVALTLSLGLALWLGRALARPTLAVSRAARQVAGGDLSARVGLGRGDPAEVRALRSDFDRMAGTLEQADGARRALFADVAHELRTPIAAMQARLEMMQDGLQPLDAHQLARLHTQTLHLGRLVDDLRTLSLAEAGQLRLKRGPLEVQPLLDGVLAQFQPLAEGRRQHLSLHAAGPLGRAEWDSARLTQLLGNLLDNALRAAPEGGWVRLNAERQENTLHLSVTDNGPGLSDEALPHVFDRFWKSDSAGKGSGLGLAIAHEVARLHGGTLTARRATGGGAAFDVTLPGV